MRHTPVLDRCGITFKENVPDHAVNIIDSCVAVIERWIDWGEFEGKKRKPCDGQPILLAGLPLGQYHCEVCGEMEIAGMAHFPPDEDYELVMGRPWPSGYEE